VPTIGRGPERLRRDRKGETMHKIDGVGVRMFRELKDAPGRRPDMIDPAAEIAQVWSIRVG
jgi:hypothetical protein